MASITQQAVPQPARLGAVSSWQMDLVAANHPFSDFADFAQSNFVPFLFFFPSQVTALGNCILALETWITFFFKKLKINVVSFLCSKPNGFGFSRSFVCFLQMLLSRMPRIHNQLWLLLSVLTFLAQSLESQQDKFWLLKIIFLMLYG